MLCALAVGNPPLWKWGEERSKRLAVPSGRRRNGKAQNLEESRKKFGGDWGGFLLLGGDWAGGLWANVLYEYGTSDSRVPEMKSL